MSKSKIPDSGKIGWKAPSNIALVKYWGKKGRQIPSNTSISFTLDEAVTKTIVSFQKKENRDNFSIEVWLDGERAEGFEPKILEFFERIGAEFSFLKEYHFRIDTQNSFPHSSGIASSASGFAALALCLCSMNDPEVKNEKEFYRHASYIARLGSGSAARSIYGGIVIWGDHKDIEESYDEYAAPFEDEVDPVFKSFCDTILIVEEGQKQVSSSLGHSLMDSNPFSSKRFEIAQIQVNALKKCLKNGDIEGFGKIVEQEALMLHGLMMTSDPYFLLMKANTVNIIHKVWEKRNQTGIKLYITLDAGANVHLLYPKSEENEVSKFIENELVAYCKNKQYLCDRVGKGPVQLEL